MSMTYLASPYSHLDPEIREQRFREACRAAWWLMNNGRTVFSPIAHSHPIEAQSEDGTRPFEFWMEQDLPLLRLADELVVLTLPGWAMSRGVAVEIETARTAKIATRFLESSSGHYVFTGGEVNE